MSDVCGITHIRYVHMLTYQAKDTAIWEVVRQLCKGFALQGIHSFVKGMTCDSYIVKESCWLTKVIAHHHAYYILIFIQHGAA